MSFHAATSGSPRPRAAIAACFALLLTGLAACGGDPAPTTTGSPAISPSPEPSSPPDTSAEKRHQVAGSLSGLAPGYTVTLLNNGGDALALDANGAFSFSGKVSGPYAVTVGTAPPWHTCTVTQGAGTASADVGGVAVSCALSATVSTIATVNVPTGLARDASGNFYVSSSSGFVGTGSVVWLPPNGSPTTIVSGLDRPSSVAVTPDGNVYVVIPNGHVIRRVAGPLPVGVFAGSGVRDEVDGTGTAASFSDPFALASDGNGNLYVTDSGGHRIRKITPAGEVTTLAGTVQGYADGPAGTAQFDSPGGVAVEADGTVYVTELLGHRIRKISPSGEVSTLAGQGTAGGEDGPGMNARFNQPAGLAIGPDGALYVSELGGQRVRRVSRAGVVSTLAGTGGFGSADGPALTATFISPLGLAFDEQGSLYVADAGNNKLRKISP